MVLDRQLDREFNHQKERLASRQVQLDKRHQKVAHRRRLLPFGHPFGFVQVRVLPEFFLRQLDDIGITAGKFPALVGFLNKIHPNNLSRDEHGLGMFAGQNDARWHKQTGGFDFIPEPLSLGFVTLRERLYRYVRQVNTNNEAWFL